MIYLSSFRFPSWDSEYSFRLNNVKRTCYNTMYPFFVLSRGGLSELNFTEVTVLCGGNGSGKTTALNVIAEKLALSRGTLFNRSSFFGDYLKMCSFGRERDIPAHSAVITSDDVFSYMLDIRAVNEGVDLRREELFEEYNRNKRELSSVRSLDDYERLKDIVDSRRLTQSKFVKSRLGENVKEQSNGESAFYYFTQKIKDGGLYLLDEPENSLAPDLQLRLCDFLCDSARFYGCQFIIATHSPFILSMRGARIYDMDDSPVNIKKWTELKNVRTYYEFFKTRGKDFE